MKLPSDIRVVRAGPEHVKELIVGLSAGTQAPSQVDYYAAIKEQVLMGGVGIQTSRQGTKTVTSFQLTFISVAPDGTADLLVQAVKVLARRQGALSVKYLGSVLEGSLMAELLERCNFSRAEEAISMFQVKLNHPNWQRFEDTFTKLKSRGKIPEDARVLPLNRLASMTVSELVNKNIGGIGPELMHELLNQETLSVGVKIGSSLKGVIVASLRESDLYISLMAIDSSVRGSWLYTLLGYEVLKAARKDPKLTTWSFKTNPGIHRGILNFAKTMEADHIGDEYTWEFPLED